MNSTAAAAPVNSTSDLPSDGCITIRPWDGSRRQGWHVEAILSDFSAEGGTATVWASPMSICSGVITGEPRKVQLAFGLDDLEVMA